MHNLIPAADSDDQAPGADHGGGAVEADRRQKADHFVTGYVHKPYPPVYADLARVAGFDTACIVRGVEWWGVSSLAARRPRKYFHYHDKADEIERIASIRRARRPPRCAPLPLPGSVALRAGGRTNSSPPIDIKATAHAAAEAGILALKGDKGATYDSLVLAGSIILHHVGKAASVADARRRFARCWIPARPSHGSAKHE